MFGIERLQAIRELIKEKKSVEVVYLGKELDVSEVTIRRDLDKLEKEGFIAKTYGGAILIEDTMLSGQRKYDIMLEQEHNISDDVIRVAKTASKLIDTGDTVFISGGDLGMALAMALKEKDDLIVVTNNIEVAIYLYKYSDFKTIFIGGEIDRHTGNVTEMDQLDELLIEKAFVTAEGIDDVFGYTVNEKNDVRLYKKLRSVSRNLIVLCMADAFGRRGLVKMAPLDTIEFVVTEKNLPDSFKRYYFEHNITVHTSILNID
ncbi:MAG: DeoR/GlpR family DNA-binding transcription regulator [Vallitaleaceae bacterium]|jgi:DeoR family fructose operon transcriptional repressor|nr:DeoR/GlpR family DNA-binding transcription regulator [Vallitaleaceae bacterium]